jgi:hypothetical protein
MYKLGHEIVTWDEEALVHLPPEMYFSRRLSRLTMQYLSHLFAWGEDNAEEMFGQNVEASITTAELG